MSDNENKEITHVEAVPMEKNALEAMERASIDIQIATAHQYPRSLTLFNERAKEMVSVDTETAESCIYRRPVGKDRSGKLVFASGESIRLAEIVAACYGNIRVGAIISEMTPTYVKAIGMAHDLETNNAQKAEVVESTLTKEGKPYDERMRVVVAKAAQSKAIRDAIFRVVPKSLCKSITKVAMNVIGGAEKPLEERRAAVESWLSKLSIDKKRVFVALGVNGIEEIGVEELENLTGLRTALKENDITLEEAFPPLSEKQKQGVDALQERLEQKQNGNVTQDPIIYETAGNERDTDIAPSHDTPQEAIASKESAGEAADAGQPSPADKIPAGERYLCRNCDKTFAEPKVNQRGKKVEKCPHCLYNNFIDRWQK